MSFSDEKEPVNLLALDGGGIRGVSELIILDELMKQIQIRGNLARVPRPCVYFHLMGGTSTGGLVAIMLGRLEMSTEEALSAYDKFAQEIFSKKNRNMLNPAEKYGAVALEQTVQKLVHDCQKGPSMRDCRPYTAKGRAFVCTMPQHDRNATVRLRTYDVEGDKFSKCQIYQAARATTAASTFFKPMPIQNDQGVVTNFVDAALGRNNPVGILLEEAGSLFGTRRRLGCVVSLGTGSRKTELAKGKSKAKQLVSLLSVLKEISTDTQRDHERMLSMLKDFPDTYFRLNVDGGAEKISLDDWGKIGLLKERTRKYLQDKAVADCIDKLAKALLRGTSHGLTLAHLGGLDKDVIIRDTQKAKPRGRASTIFTGRATILKTLREHFNRQDSGDVSRREFQLWGMGGVGKTQIALKFSEEFERNDYKILWIDATDVYTIEQSYLRIVEKDLQPENRGDGAITRLLGKLEASDKWLLVFDNAPERGLGPWIPDGNSGNIIYTTRLKHLERRLAPNCVSYVDQMDVADGLTLLLRSARMDEGEKQYRDLARPVAKELGYLPLALDQAGAYIHMAPCPLERFLEKFNNEKDALLSNPMFRGEDNIRNLPIYATFNISWDAIKAYADKRKDVERATEALNALQLLNLLCFYHNEGFIAQMFGYAAKNRAVYDLTSAHPLEAEGISLEHLIHMSYTEDFDMPGNEWNRGGFDMGIRFLEEFSLLKHDYRNLHTNMHILVHEWARRRLTPGQRAEWGGAARRILLDSFNFESLGSSIAHRREMVVHLDACVRFVDPDNQKVDLEPEYHFNIANIYEAANRFEDARLAREKSTFFALRRAAGFFTENVLMYMYMQADDYGSHCDIAQAEQMYLEILDRFQLIVDQAKWQAIPSRKGKRSMLKLSRDEKNADNRREEVLDFNLARDTKASLAFLYFEQGHYESAEPHLLDILEWAKQDTGREKERAVIRARDYLATIANPSGARPSETSEEAKAKYLAREEESGSDSFGTQSLRRNFAIQLVREGKLEEALDEYHPIWLWYCDKYGKESNKTRQVLDAMVLTMHKVAPCHGFTANVLIMSFSWNHFTFGPQHLETLESRGVLADVLCDMCALGKALELAEGSVKIARAIYGEGGRTTLYHIDEYRRIRELYETMPLFIRLRVIQDKILEEKKAPLTFGPLHEYSEKLADWEPHPIATPLTPEGTEVRVVKEEIPLTFGVALRYKQLDVAAADFQIPSLEAIIPDTWLLLCRDAKSDPKFRDPGPFFNDRFLKRYKEGL
ncbi:hypothetical protein M406DRAFT_352811 [Cryphonectria parasitica EP155]|uniref:PNPLA domain-containing protein n=1 Tax=Cryphonectria parasitica (strain ATCC 38755 / EP155) TaxID=660469 RepID=A0A9P4XWF2_CRYP1|nr:uncharacterized protein M406DRAFT_352811 [Cryphonectria parasitica EP155]KAF3762534.1 hypothetical protein M406DRAFT_352811 [Cryphonectria parasitica EP155]